MREVHNKGPEAEKKGPLTRNKSNNVIKAEKAFFVYKEGQEHLKTEQDIRSYCNSAFATLVKEKKISSSGGGGGGGALAERQAGPPR